MEMSSSLKPRRQGVATYLQTFILIAVALGGSLLAYREVSGYASSAGGPTIQVWEASLRQGAGLTIERLVVSNSGNSGSPFVTVLNPDLAAGATYCYTAASMAGTQEAGTCPSMDVNPTSIRVAAGLTPGNSLVVTVFIEGAAVHQGGVYPLLVTAPGSGVASERVVASPD